MGWLTRDLRINLIKAVITWAAKLLGREDEIEGIFATLTDEILDTLFRIRRRPRRTGQRGQRTPSTFVAQNVLGEIQLIAGNIEQNLPADALAEYRAYIQEQNEYIERERQVQYQRNLVGANSALARAIELGQQDFFGFYYCRGCNTEGNVPTGDAHLRRYGSKHEGCCHPAWVLVLGANGRLVNPNFIGYCPCGRKGRLSHTHVCSLTSTAALAHGYAEPKLNLVCPPADWQPTRGDSSSLLVNVFDDEGILTYSFNTMTDAAKKAISLAGASLATAPDFMKKKNGSLLGPKTVQDRMSDIIIGRRGLEDGSFVIGGYTFTGSRGSSRIPWASIHQRKNLDEATLRSIFPKIVNCEFSYHYHSLV